MKKSPLSTPGGSRGKANCNWGGEENSQRTGYGYAKGDVYQCISPGNGRMSCGDDFIPLNVSTPVSEPKRQNNTWYGFNRNHRNAGSGGFSHYRNNYHASPNTNFNNSYSPYKHSGKPLHGQKKTFQKYGMHRQVDISKYVDMKSFLEDPWAELMKKLNDSKETAENELSKDESLRSGDLGLHEDSRNKVSVDVSVDGSVQSQESRESSVNMSIQSETASDSPVSGAVSCNKLLFDKIELSQESKYESLCSSNASVESEKEDVYYDVNGSGTSSGQKHI